MGDSTDRRKNRRFFLQKSKSALLRTYVTLCTELCFSGKFTLQDYFNTISVHCKMHDFENTTKSTRSRAIVFRCVTLSKRVTRIASAEGASKENLTFSCNSKGQKGTRNAPKTVPNTCQIDKISPLNENLGGRFRPGNDKVRGEILPPKKISPPFRGGEILYTALF